MVVTQKSISFDFKDAILSSMWLRIPFNLSALAKVWSGLEIIGNCPPGLLERQLFMQRRLEVFS